MTRRLELRKEDRLKDDMLKDLTRQGLWARKIVDRFKAGYPDLRIVHRQRGPLDVELKYIDWPIETLEAADLIDLGMRKIQWVKIGEMNKAGTPAICLVYFEALGYFGVSTVLRDTLPPPERRVVRVTKPGVIRATELYDVTMEHLHGQGYRYPHD